MSLPEADHRSLNLLAHALFKDAILGLQNLGTTLFYAASHGREVGAKGTTVRCLALESIGQCVQKGGRAGETRGPAVVAGRSRQIYAAKMGEIGSCQRQHELVRQDPLTAKEYGI
jgi:hypothetical protein